MPINATYEVFCSKEELPVIAKAIAWEQTVEVVESVVSDSIRDQLVGKISDIRPGSNAHEIDIQYNPVLASNSLGQLFNLAYGNVSLYRNVRLTKFNIPNSLADTIKGPQFGIDGIRKLTGVFDRPLLSTALKPRGESIEKLASIAHSFALGGGDIIKDDQNLVDEDLEIFKARVYACAKAVEAACQVTGRCCLYLPHITGSGRQLERQLEFIKAIGLQGVLMCPMILGLETAKQAAFDYQLIYMAHPALAGSFYRPTQHGINADILQGLFYRLSGADISIFTSEGGRISTSLQTCQNIQHQLTQPLGKINKTMPCPAGGNTLDLIPRTIQTYGKDVLILCGGALLSHDKNLTTSTKIFANAVRENHTGIQRETTLPKVKKPNYAAQFLKKTADGWQNRQAIAYKTDQTLSHQNASKVELLGQQNEDIAFSLRYFELQPGGYTSLEQHQHTHTVIGAKGIGELQMGNTLNILKAHDIAYIPGHMAHQLRNHSEQPFGFYCIVDRRRDRPTHISTNSDKQADKLK